MPSSAGSLVVICCCSFWPLPGDPKGVLLKHSAVVATVAGLVAFLEGVVAEKFGVGDVTLSYLPLAHILDRWGNSADCHRHIHELMSVKNVGLPNCNMQFIEFNFET